VSLRLSASKIRKGELIWFSGRVAGPSASGRKVVLERRKPGATKWKAYTSARTKASGKFAGSVRPAAAYQYRVRVVAKGGTTVRSKARTVRLVKGTRTLSSRVGAIPRSRLGKAVAPATTLSRAQATATRARQV